MIELRTISDFYFLKMNSSIIEIQVKKKYGIYSYKYTYIRLIEKYDNIISVQ